MSQRKFTIAILLSLTLGAVPALADPPTTGQMSADKVACAAQASGNAVTAQTTPAANAAPKGDATAKGGK